MYIAISHLGIDNHIAVLEEEKKHAAALRETLQQLRTQEQYNPLINIGTISECLESIRVIEKSIQYRTDFLNRLNIKTQKQSENNKKMLEGLKTEYDK